ncbi:MAG: BolA family protein [Rhodospirillaceae bacterium]|nr:BolA family protein [Rhodospirillaceae bacterium]
MGIVRDRIAAKLTAGLAPEALQIVDDSARHAGHAGAHPDGGGETHFRVAVVAAAFAGKSRLDRQRLVYGLLAEELKQRVHALELKLSAPGEV